MRKRPWLLATIDTTADPAVGDGGGTPAPTDTGTTPAAPVDGGQGADNGESTDTALGDGGLKALRAEREAHKAAQRDLAAARQALEAMTAERDTANAARDEAITQRDAAILATARHTAAAQAGLPAFWVDRLQGTTPEELANDAKALAAHIPATGPAPVLPPDPSQGRGSGGKGTGTMASGRDLYHQTHKTKTQKG